MSNGTGRSLYEKEEIKQDEGGCGSADSRGEDFESKTKEKS